MKFCTRLKIYWIKFITSINTALSMLVYNFHKKINGIKTKKNIPYKIKPNFFQKMDVHYPADTSISKPIIVYFHGGGWTAYSKHIFTTLTRRLADMGYVVFNCNYSLSPKYKMDNIMQDAVSAIKMAQKFATSFGGDPDKIVLAGDSAGAYMSSMIMAKTTLGDPEYKGFNGKIRALLLFYGVFNLETALLSGFNNIKTYIDACIPGGIANSEELKKYSPINFNLSGFAPCFLASGAIDKLHNSQSKIMKSQLQQNGVKVDSLFFDKDEYKAMHAYMIIDGLSTNVETLAKVETFLKEVL